MTSRERIRRIIAGEPADRCGFWLGNPHPDTWLIYHRFFGTADEESIRQSLGDDFRWICPQFFPGAYRAPDGRGMFDAGLSKKCHGQAGPLAEAESLKDVESFPWPDPKYLHFDDCMRALEAEKNHYRASGFWTSFYHNIMDLFGMEQYMVYMYERPHIVEAVTDRVCSFYYEANERFFRAAKGLMEGFFFGNDFGTQLDLICSPEHFDRFILPWFRRFTDQGHRHGLQVILHSCGAIHRVIDRLIDAGVDCLHPLQARAAHMDAETLSRDYRGRIAFLGGIDTQELLVRANPAEVKEEVRRVKRLLGPRLIVSPSHEALLVNVPPQNIVAMAEAAVEA